MTTAGAATVCSKRSKLTLVAFVADRPLGHDIE